MPGLDVCRGRCSTARAVADQMSTTGATADGPVSHYLGGLATVLGRYDEADEYFAQAAAFNDRGGAKFFAARTNLSWGEDARRAQRSGRQEGSGPSHQGQTAAAAHGYANVERRAAEALQDLN